MIILHLESSSKNCSVAISDGLELLAVCEERSEDFKQSENLHTFVSWALEGAGVAFQDLDAVCIGMGPGSYTGLRIGTAAAKGYCFALGIPLLAVNSLESLIRPFLAKGYDYIIPMVDARRMEVYTAIFDGAAGNIIRPTEALILEPDSFSEYEGKKVVFVGDGAAKTSEILPFAKDNFLAEVFPSAEHLVSRAVDKFQKKQFEDVAYFEPFYLKDFHSTVSKK